MNDYTKHPLHHKVYFTLAGKIINIADLLEEYLQIKLSMIKQENQERMENRWKS